MAYEITGLKFTLPAAADLSASQYCFLSCNATSQAALLTTAVNTVGVLQNKPAAANVAAEIMVNAVSKVKAGATVAAGANVMADGSGRAITATSTNKIIGIALTGGAVNEIISVYVANMGTF